MPTPTPARPATGATAATKLQSAVKADMFATFGTADLKKVKAALKAKCDADGGSRVQGVQFIYRYSRGNNSAFHYSVAARTSATWCADSRALDGDSFAAGIERHLGDTRLTTPVFGKPYEVDFLARLIRK